MLSLNLFNDPYKITGNSEKNQEYITMASKVIPKKKKSVKDIFEKMDYDITSEENCDLAIAWLEKQKNNFSASAITTETIGILSSQFASGILMIQANKTNEENVQQLIKEAKIGLDEWSKLKGLEKSKALNKFAAEIDKNSMLLCQLEMKVRDIFTKDTKNYSIPTLSDYLQFYSSWAAVKNKASIALNPYGICVASLHATTPLAFVGIVMAPCLAAGNVLILNVEEELIPICFLIRELAIIAGVPKNAIHIVSGDLQTLLKQESVEKLTYIGDLFSEKYTSLQLSDNINVNTLHLGKSNMIVFDSADLDSVADSILEVAINYRGYYPWSVQNIFVQETVYENLKKKIDSKYRSLKVVEKSSMKNGDAIKATLPELKFGHKDSGNNIVKSNNNNCLYVLPFRTASEGVALVNNTKLGLAASVWTENMSLANEVINKLKVAIVWFNSYGKINPSTSFTPFKKSGKGYFGGKEGFFEYVKHQNKIDFTPVKYEVSSVSSQLPGNTQSKICLYYAGGFKKPESGLDYPNKKDVRNCVEQALKAQESWKKLSGTNRGQLLCKFADSSSTIEKSISSWVEILYEWSVFVKSSFLNIGASEFIMSKEPYGVMAVELYSTSLPQLFNFIIGSISCGNSIIILNRSDKEDVLKEICSKCTLPAGILNVINCQNKDVIDALKNHQEVTAYFLASENKLVHISNQHIVRDLKKINLDCNESILNAVTMSKIVSYSVGESFM